MIFVVYDIIQTKPTALSKVAYWNPWMFDSNFQWYLCSGLHDEQKKPAVVDKKPGQKWRWIETLTSRKVFCNVLMWKQALWKEEFEFVFFSVMVAVSFLVSFSREINNLGNYKACQT